MRPRPVPRPPVWSRRSAIARVHGAAPSLSGRPLPRVCEPSSGVTIWESWSRIVLGSPIAWAMKLKGERSRWLRVQQAADLLGVSASTVRRWADSGRIVASRTPSGQRRLARGPLEALVSGREPRGDPERRSDDAERRYQLLLETSLELASTLEIGEVLQSAARRLSAVLQIRDCDIYRLDGDERLVCIASILDGARDDTWVGETIALREWPCKRSAIDTGRAVAVASADDPRLGEAERENMRGYAQRSCVSLPLVARDKVIGLVSLLDRVERAFTQEEITTGEAVAKLVALALEHAQLYDEVKNLHLGNLRALSSALSAKDYYTLGHASRVAAYMALLGRELGWPAERLEKVENVAFLHDIGKIGVSDRVLLKAGPLTSEEWELIRQHPGISAEIVRPLFPSELVAGVRHHHERFDGKGYPDGLAGEAIPPLARAMCVVDCYDAMSCQRPYRPALSYRQCLAELRRCAGAQFDPGDGHGFPARTGAAAAPADVGHQSGQEAAQLIDPAAHAVLRSRADEASRQYAEMAAALRQFRDAHPPVRFVTSFAMAGDQCITVLDTGETENEVSHCGDPWLAEDELARVLAQQSTVTNVLIADDFGVWVSGIAPVRDEKGTIVAAVTVDAPVVGSLARDPQADRSHTGGDAAVGGDPFQPGGGRGHHRWPDRALQPPLPPRAPRGRDRAGTATQHHALAAVLRLRQLQDLQRQPRAQGRRRRPGEHRPRHRSAQSAGRSGRSLRRRGVRACLARDRRRGSTRVAERIRTEVEAFERQGGPAPHGERRRGHLSRRRRGPRPAARQGRRAMYGAKLAGRNRVASFSDDCVATSRGCRDGAARSCRLGDRPSPARPEQTSVGCYCLRRASTTAGRAPPTCLWCDARPSRHGLSRVTVTQYAICVGYSLLCATAAALASLTPLPSVVVLPTSTSSSQTVSSTHRWSGRPGSHSRSRPPPRSSRRGTSQRSSTSRPVPPAECSSRARCRVRRPATTR